MQPHCADVTATRRIAWLDGLRGVAILAVLLFHAYVRWPEVVPFGDRFSGRPWVAYGWLGVQLFFMISGFVIALTLERCRGMGEFIARRWWRLFPAMAVATVFIYCTAPLFPERPAGAPHWADTLPGLLFIDPEWIAWATGRPQRVLEGAFWSLFVEAKFYLVSAAAYFAAGRAGLLAALIGTFALSLVAGAYPSIEVLHAIVRISSASYFGWFACGAMFYVHSRSGRRIDALVAILLGALAAATQPGYQLYPQMFAMAPVVLFAATALATPMQLAMSTRFLAVLGFMSYPLYLVHENLVVALIAKAGRLAPGLAPMWLPVVPMLLVALLAWLIASHLEPWTRQALRALRSILASSRLQAVASERSKP